MFMTRSILSTITVLFDIKKISGYKRHNFRYRNKKDNYSNLKNTSSETFPLPPHAYCTLKIKSKKGTMYGMNET